MDFGKIVEIIEDKTTPPSSARSAKGLRNDYLGGEINNVRSFGRWGILEER